MSAECLKNNEGGWKQAHGVTRVGNEETNLCCFVLTKPLQTEIEGDSRKTKTLIIQQSSFTVAEEANKKSTALP